MNWKNIPSETESLAIIMEDLDFQNGFNHWIIWCKLKAFCENENGLTIVVVGFVVLSHLFACLEVKTAS